MKKPPLLHQKINRSWDNPQELAQQVSDFAGQHEQQAAALQAQLEHLETQVGLLTKQYAIIAADYKALAAL